MQNPLPTREPATARPPHTSRPRWGRLLPALLLLLASFGARAQQASDYKFAASSGTFTPITGATVLPLIAVDSYITPALPVGFNFVFEGVTYTTVKASSNNFLSFGAGINSGTTNDLSGIAAASRPLLAPLWDDNDGRPTGATAIGSYVTTGTSPNQVFTFEWLNWEWRFGANVAVISMQVKLYEGTNVIQYIYQQEPGATDALATNGASIGLAGAAVGNFLSLSDATAAPTASSLVETNGIFVKPATGQTYTFTPGTCFAPTGLTAANLTTNSATVNFTPSGGSTAASGYTFRYRPAGSMGAYTTGTLPAGATSANLTGLMSGTNYEFGIQANCSASDASKFASFNFTTSFVALSGAYTINSGQPTGGTNFNNFTDAAFALKGGGVSGPVTLTVVAGSGPYTEQFTLNQLTGTSATNTVTFNGNGRTIQFAPTVSTTRAVITLAGADFVTINNLVVDATVGGTSTGTTYGTGIQLFNSSDNVTLTNNTVTVSTDATTTAIAGIGASGSQTSFTTGGATASQNLTITGNTVTGGHYGIITTGNSTATPTAGFEVRNNNVRDFYSYGVYLYYGNAAQIIGNDISRPTRTTNTTIYGIYLNSGSRGTAVERNRIHNALSASATSTSTVYGIYVTTGTAATAAQPNDIVNNLIYDLDGNGTVGGIYNTGSAFTRIYHNTVNADDQGNTSTSITYGIYNSSSSSVDVRNNISRVTRSGTGPKYSLYYTSAAVATGTTSDYNDLTGGGTNYNVGYNGTARVTLADWQTASGKDANSVSVAPGFVSAGTGNLTPTTPALDGTGLTLARVPDDFTGATRTSPPDIGAIEFMVAAADIAVVSIDAPVAPVGAGPSTVTVTVRNNGGSALTSVTLAYTLNGGAAVSQTFTSLNVASGATTQLSFTAQATLVGGSNTLVVTGSLPNGMADPTPANNTQTKTLFTALAGAYTINNLQPTAGTNFISFTDAAAALNGGGVAAAVTFAVSNGPYTEQFLLNEVTGSSATNTITINGNGRTIKFAPTVSGQRGVIILNGTDFVTLDGLDVDATDGGAGSIYGFGIQLYGNADNNIIRNNTVTTNTVSTSANYIGISVSGSATSGTGAGAGANQNVTVENNTVNGGDSGITLIGNSAASPTTGLVARGNTVRGFNNNGIYTASTDGVQIIGNDVARPLRGGTVGIFYGVYLAGGVRSAAVERNRIHQAFPAATNTSAAYGIYVATGTSATAGTENDIVNNLIYDLDGNGIVGGIYNTSSSFARYYHNTVNVADQTNTSASVTYGFYNTGASGVEFVNNIVQITRSGTGAQYALYFTTTAVAAATTTNYNDLVGSGANFNVARINSPANNYATLADWQAQTLAPGKDANSVSVVPGFASLNNLTPSAPALDGAGTPLARVTNDFALVARANPPDIGALEFTPVNTDLSATGLVAPTATQGCYGAAEAVTVSVRNNGVNTLSFATNNATVTVVVTPPTGPAQTLTGTVSTGTLASGASQNVTLSGTLDMTALGTYSFAISATVAGDQDTSNDLLVPSPTRTKVAPTAGTLSPATSTLCTGSTATLSVTGADNGTIQFQSSSSASGPFADIAGATLASYTSGPLTQTTYFRTQTICGALVATSNVSAITVNDPQPVSTNAPQTICAGNTATLTATGSTGQMFQFFSAATGGTALASTTGGTVAAPTASFTTPALAANTTYYVETTSDNSETVGRPAPTSGSGFGSASNYGLIFDVLTATTLKTVTVVSVSASGPITIDLQDASGTVLASASGTVVAGTSAVPVPSVITLNFALAPGTGYRLTQTTAIALVRESSVGGYPYNSSGGSVSITSSLLSGSANANNYYWFYDWQLGSTCTGTRTALQVNVNQAPTFTTTQSNVACFGGTGSIVVTAAGGTGTFEYSSNGGTSYQASNTFSGLAAGTYSILVRNLGGTQCVAAAAQSVTITAPASATSVTATKTDATAFGSMDGTITATGAGGTSPYQYSTNGTTFLPATATAGAYTFTGLNPGTYTVTVRDANACTSTTTITVGGPTTAPCTAATNLGTSAITNTSATVNFAGSASATGYTVTTSPVTTTQTLAAGATSVGFSGLTPGTAYAVSIVSNCAGGATSPAATTTFTTTAICNAVTNLTNTNVTTSSATVNFVGSNSATSYTVTTSPVTTTQTLPAGTVSVSFSGLSANTAYAVSIRSNCAGGLTATATGSFTTQASACAAPGTPSFASITQTSASVSFVPSASNVGPYTVTATGGGNTFTVSGANSPLTLTGLTAGTAYSVTVTGTCTAAAGGGASPASAAATLTTTAAPCNAPTALTASAITASSATVSFTGSASATGYTVTTSPATTTTQTLGAAATSVSFTGLSASTAYTVSIVSNCAAGATSSPATVTFTTTAPAPGDLTVSTTQGGISGTYNNVTITGTGNATLGGALVVNGTLTVQNGGTLNTSCQTVSGPGSFMLSPGATLAICDPQGISSSGATGAIQTTGTRSFAPDASYLYNGTAAQMTGSGLPAQVRNLTVNNPANVTQTQAVAVAQLLTLTSGNLATGGQTLTLLSSAAGTAVVVNTNGAVTGTATVQRYIDPSLNPGLGYRHYSAPVSNTNLADLTTPGFAPTLNSAYNTSATPSLVTPFPTVFGYDETRVGTITSNYGPFDQGFLSPATASAPMVVAQGYTVNIGANQLVDFVGTLNNGTQTKSGLTRGTNAQSGWHLLGNPFPSPIDVTAFVPANFNNVDNAVYVYRSTGQYVGQYTTFVNGIGTSQPVATAQGFFVRASTAGTAGSLTMPQAARVTTYGPTPAFQRGTAGTRPVLQLELSGATGSDAAYVYFEAGATATAPEPTRDAVKLPNPTGLNLASAAGNGEELAINGLPLLAAQPVIVPLRLTAPVAGSYTFAVAELANFDATTVVELRDALTGTVQVLAPQARLRVTLAAGATGSRFTLVFRPGAILATRGNLDAALVNLYPNPARGRFVVELPALTGATRVEATLLNALGQQVRSQSKALNAQGTTLEFGTENLAAGVYSLRLQAGGLQVVKRVVVE